MADLKIGARKGRDLKISTSESRIVILSLSKDGVRGGKVDVKANVKVEVKMKFKKM